jgi:threonine dehydrogenase-like Zn-dependent dehydrogenase
MRISQVIGPRTSEVVTAPDPVPGDHQVLVEVVASGVCTSDLTPWRTGRGGGVRDGESLRLGHEITGRILAAGRLARGWSEGDLVTGLGSPGFASHAVLEAAHILPVPDGIDPALAIGEPVADLAEALSRTGMGAGDRVAVVGLGFMGLGLVQLALDRAPGLLIGVDPLPDARQRALDLGADLVFAPDEVPAEFGGPAGGGAGRAGGGDSADGGGGDSSGGSGGEGGGDSGGDGGELSGARDLRPDIVLEATGVTPGLAMAGALVRPFGTLCVVGYHHTGDAPMDMGLWYKAVTIVNGFCPDKTRLMRAMRDALDLIAAHRFSYAPLITHRFGLDEVDRAYQLMDSRAEGFVKAVLIP